MNTYTKSYSCRNCNNYYELAFNYGEVADDDPTCPKCGVSDSQLDKDRFVLDMSVKHKTIKS